MVQAVIALLDNYVSGFNDRISTTVFFILPCTIYTHISGCLHEVVLIKTVRRTVHVCLNDKLGNDKLGLRAG